MRINIQQDTHTVVVAGGGRWAQGETLDAAKREFRNYGGRLSDGYMVAEFGTGSEFTGVDGYGYTHYLGAAPTMTLIGKTGHVIEDAA